MESARILSYGYDANFSTRENRDSSLDIAQFARELLYSLSSAIDEGQGTPVGQIPLMFVAHSMGGLVVKKAYIIGWQDEQYEYLVRACHSIVFLATPHRGCHLPEMLNNLLLTSLAGHASIQYINELSTRGRGLRAINEQWHALSPSVSVASLYETLPTRIGSSKIQVLNEHTSTIGNSSERTKSLHADHHSICKYSTRLDPNYISVCDLLKYAVSKFQSQKLSMSRSIISDSSEGGVDKLETFLGTIDALQNDLEFFSEKQMLQSCQWLIEEDEYLAFTGDTSSSGILWCTGPPGFGKSVLCSSVIQNLVDQGERVVFHFFRFGDQTKNNIAKTLASLAYQAAVAVPTYRRSCIRIAKQVISIRSMTTRSLWQKLYADALFKLHESRALYMVIDGLDECDDATALLKYLQGIKSSSLCIKIIIFSRKTHDLHQTFEKMAKAIPISTFDLSRSNVDLQNYIHEEMEHMHGDDDDFRHWVQEQLLLKAQGNFLWTSLVISEISQCHTQEDVQEALLSVPTDLEDLYLRMNASLERRLRDVDQKLAKDIFEWVVCARRALSLDELRHALSSDHPKLLDLAFTIGKVCGDFVVVDNQQTVSMIHLTAKDFLLQNLDLKFHIPEKETHHRLLLKCLTAVQNFETQMSRGPVKITTFMQYAATSWPFHLQRSLDEADQDSSAILAEFFSTPCVLTWIYLLADARQLRSVVHAAKVVTSFIRHSKKLDEERNPMVHRLQEREILAQWSTDLLRLVGKFAPQLLSNPKLIFRLIPPFCPPDSAIHQQFGVANGQQSIEICGLVNTSWDDCVAKFAAPNGQTPLALRCSSQFLAMLLRDGTVVLYHSDTLEEARSVRHGERVSAWAFNQLGDRLVTSSMSHTTVWNPLTAEDIVTIPHTGRLKPLTISFSENDNSLVTCADDREIRRLRLNLNAQEDSEIEDDVDSLAEDNLHTWSPTKAIEDVPKWQVLEGALGSKIVEGRQLGSPRCVEFHGSGTLVAVFYREFQLSVWSLEGILPELVSTCRRSYSADDLHGGVNMVIQSICWNNVTGHILGMDRETKCIFKWHPYSNEYSESNEIPVGTISCSADGKLFVTGSQDGSIRIWDFQHLFVIYQLSCNVLVTDLTIDPEGFRIYDIREKFCSVWNPNALIRMWEVDDSASDDALSTRESSIPSSSFSDSAHVVTQSITSLALCSKTFDFAVGDDQGNVTHFSSIGERLNILGKGFMTINPVCWSNAGTLIAYSDLARQILVESLSPLGSLKPAANILRSKEIDRTKCLLFSNDDAKLLVGSDTDVRLWSIEDRKRISFFPQAEPTVWICLPTQDDYVFGFGISSAYIISWDDSSKPKVISFGDQLRHEALTGASDGTSITKSSQVTKALTTIDGREVLLQMTTTSPGCRRNQWVLADVSRLQENEVSFRSLPTSLQERMLMPLGFVSADATEPESRRSSLALQAERRRSSAYSVNDSKGVRSPSPRRLKPGSPFVFIDLDHWVCSAIPAASIEDVTIRRHYFLPRDWLNGEILQMAILRPDGTLLCPRNGEVAIVMHGLRQEWND